MDWDILVHLLKKIAPAVHYHLVYYYGTYSLSFML